MGLHVSGAVFFISHTAIFTFSHFLSINWNFFKMLPPIRSTMTSSFLRFITRQILNLVCRQSWGRIHSFFYTLTNIIQLKKKSKTEKNRASNLSFFLSFTVDVRPTNEVVWQARAFTHQAIRWDSFLLFFFYFLVASIRARENAAQ